MQNPPHNAPLFRARLFERAGGGMFDAALDPLSDWDLWVRSLVVGGARMWMMEQPIALWYHGDRQYSATHAATRNAAVSESLRRYCAAWRAAVPALKSCVGTGVVSRNETTRIAVPPPPGARG